MKSLCSMLQPRMQSFSLLLQMNTNPVRIGLYLKDQPCLLSNLKKCTSILELMSDREFKDRRDVNEILSLKFHIIHYIVKDIMKQVRALESFKCHLNFNC